MTIAILLAKEGSLLTTKQYTIKTQKKSLYKWMVKEASTIYESDGATKLNILGVISLEIWWYIH
jgi:hypothetical protein